MSDAAMMRTPPASVSAEQAVIGALLRDNDAIDRVGDLRAEHFYRADHRTIFAAIMEMIEAGDPVDVLTVADKLRGKDVSVAYLHEVESGTPSSANIARYAASVLDRAQRRGVMALADEFSGLAQAEGGGAATEIIDRMQARLEKLAEVRSRKEPVKVADDMGRYTDEIQRRQDGGTRTIPTGFADLDNALSGGVRRGEVVVIAARPKIGKTALALTIARNAATDHAVLVLEMEMPRAQIHDRNVAAVARIPLSHLLRPNRMTESEWSALTLAVNRMMDWNLFIDDQGGLRMIDVRMKARAVKRRHGLDLIVVDYLQLMEAEGDNRNAQIESITRGIKALAKELDVGVILLSQLNRDCERRTDKRPVPSDLRDSGGIEQDADVLMLMYRDEVYNPDSSDAGIAEINIALNRQGPTGTIGLLYVGEQTRFESLASDVKFGRAARPAPKYSGLVD